MSQKKDVTISNPWRIIILVYVTIAAFIGIIISREYNNYIGLLIFLIISIFGIIGTVPNIQEEEIPKRRNLTFFIVVINEFVFYFIAFTLSVFLVFCITSNSFLFVLLNLVFTIIFIFVEIKVFYMLRPTYKIIRNYVNERINFVNFFTFFSIIGAILLSDFSLGSLNGKNSLDIETFKAIFSISSTSFLGYWLINNIINKIQQ